jgi:hypothetical protein
LRNPATATALGALLLCGAVAFGTEPAGKTAAKPSPTSAIDWFFNPPGWLTWLSLAGGLGAFGWRLVEFFVARVDRSSDRLIATNAFWYEKVVVPHILEPMLDFVTRQKDQLVAVKLPVAGGGDPFKGFLTEYHAEYARLVARIALLQVVSHDTYTKVAEILDELDDEVTLHCYRHSAGQSQRNHLDIAVVFSDALKACVREFKELHSSYYKLER